MDYLKITLQTKNLQEWQKEVLMAKLGDIGFESFVEYESNLEAYIPEKYFNKTFLEQIINEFSSETSFIWKEELIKDRNWNEEWEKNYFKPLVIMNKCVVRAPFHSDFPNCQYEIIIEPNMAFGTGNHETTSMMMEFILKEEITGKDVLDMGCGTGILSILSSMVGAKKVVSIDIDQWSFEATTENAHLNGILNIEAHLGDASLLGNQKFELILANIQRNVLLNDMEKYFKVLKPGGKLIMSGFYNDDIPIIKELAESLGLIDAGYQEKNKWVAYAFQKL